MTWTALLEQWAVLEFAWHAAFHERLASVWPDLSWREFRVMVGGLLVDDTLLAAQFTNTPTPEPDGGVS